MRTTLLLVLLLPLLASGQANTRPARYDKYYGSALDKPGAPDDPLARPVGLRYTLIYRANPTDAPRVAPPSRVFQTGERVKLQVESNVDGYLYIFMKGSSGKETLIYPDDRINNGRNEIRSWQKVTVPANGWFQITEQAGEDSLLLVVSRTPLLNEAERKAKDDERTILAMRQRLPSETRDFEFVTDDDPPKTAGGAAEPSAFVVNTNLKANASVYTTVVIRHR